MLERKGGAGQAGGRGEQGEHELSELPPGHSEEAALRDGESRVEAGHVREYVVAPVLGDVAPKVVRVDAYSAGFVSFDTEVLGPPVGFGVEAVAEMLAAESSHVFSSSY